MATEIFSSLSSEIRFHRESDAMLSNSLSPPLFKNLLFYYESETSTRPSGIVFLEGCYCERLVSAPSCIAPGSPLQTNNNSNINSSKANKEEKLQVIRLIELVC